MNTRRFFFDTEFWDTGERIHLISIGICSEDGQMYYAEVSTLEYPVIPEDHWLASNVLPHLKRDGCELSRARIAHEVGKFVGYKPEWWAYVADYDWVALSQLYGPLVNRPRGWPWTAFDAYQLPHFRAFGVKPDQPHNALSDAVALKESWARWREAFPTYLLPEFRSPR